MRRLVPALALLVPLLAGCSMTPDFQRPQGELPGGWRSGQEGELPAPQGRWWQAFGSPRLDALVDEALANNHDVKAALARIRFAEAQAGAASAAAWPTLQGTGSATATAPAGERTPDVDGRSERLFKVGGRASYELDLWGKNRAADEAALAVLRASKHDRQALGLTLAADVTNGYFRFLQACDRLAVAERHVAVQQEALDKVRARRRVGEGTDLEVAQQVAAHAQAEAAAPPFVHALSQARNQLGALVGRPPQALDLACAPLDGLVLPEAAAGLPSEVMLRRPDIAKAEEVLRAANANVGVARAKLFPSLTLSAEGGLAGLALSSVGGPGSFYWALGGSLAQTIFDGGKTLADIDASEARREELVENYRQAILNGLRDVEDALTAIVAGKRQMAAQARAVAAAREAQALSMRSFDRGISPYVTVIDAHRTWYQAEDALVTARFARASGSVQLFRAIAGPIEPGQ